MDLNIVETCIGYSQQLVERVLNDNRWSEAWDLLPSGALTVR